MSAALGATKGGGRLGQKFQGEIFKIFPARGYTPYPLLPTPDFN